MAQNHTKQGRIRQEIPLLIQKTAKACYNLGINHEILRFLQA